MAASKFTLSLPFPVHSALSLEAERLGRALPEHASVLLTEHATGAGLLASDDAERLARCTRVRQRCREFARQICRDDEFDEEITLQVFRQLRSNSSCYEDYKLCIGGVDPYQTGNRLKDELHKAIGADVRAAIGGVVRRDPNGKPITRKVLGEVVQTITLMERFNSEVVRGETV